MFKTSKNFKDMTLNSYNFNYVINVIMLYVAILKKNKY